MAIIYTYNTAIPESDDILLGTERSPTLRNPTKNFKISEIAKFIIDSTTGTSLSIPIFFDVTDPSTGLTQTTLVNSIMTQDVIGGTTLTVAGEMVVAGDVEVTGTFADSKGNVGVLGRVLTSTGTGTEWGSAPQSATFEFDQGAPATTWDITHNLGKFPSITVIDTGNTVVFGEYDYTNSNRVILTFSAAFAGKAYLN